MFKKLFVIITIIFMSFNLFANVYSNMSNKNLEGVKQAVKDGFNINELGYNNKSALMTAIDYGYLDIAKYLVEAGADINIVDEDGFTALHYAAKNGQLDLVISLIEKGANIDLYPMNQNFMPDILHLF